MASLDDAITVWQKYPKTSIYLEPKVQAIIPQLAAKLGAAGLLSRVYFTAYDAWIQSNLPDLKTAPKLSGSPPDPTALKSHGTDAVMVDEGELSSSQVDGYHSAGLRVQQAETDERDKWRAAIRKGFDSILTDSPDELKAFCPSV